ncbi:PREDICTED: uncharacterized protein LOC104600948 isoform X2 [Nelumbo nucifera]|uniref:Uncharacterized protein LOC104600948 isoform X2 n=2 Tax=Nelumbo nucifera TaxID=4432 RepID=A0A1U8AJJ3_NELNU|nr:PREDICTED: uncharacterized protein LOC104600948 isoform X2 [Nelumbo nucifera]
MDKEVANPNSCKNKLSAKIESQKFVIRSDRDEDNESSSLLSPRRGGMSKKPRKARRKVQWNDRNGNNLVEVLEFQPRWMSKLYTLLFLGTGTS